MPARARAGCVRLVCWVMAFSDLYGHRHAFTFATSTMPEQRKHQFTASLRKEGKQALLLLTGYITPDNENASARIAEQLATLKDGDELTVLIRNLYGGDTDEGMTIYHDLLVHKPKVKVDGVVASMGVPIMLAGVDIEVSAHSKFMMHRPTGGVVGDFDDMRERAGRNENTYNELAEVMATRTGMTAEQVKETLMPKGKDVWLTPAKMVELKLADRVTKGSLLRSTVAMKDLRKMDQPEDILGKFNACLVEEEIDVNQTTTMNKELLKAVGLPDTATQEQYDAAIAERIRTGDAAIAKLDEVQKDQAKVQEQELEALLDGAVKANAMTAATRDALKDQAKGGNTAVVLATAKAMVGELKPHKSLADTLRGGADSAAARKQADRADWSYKDWASRDPKGLAEMKEKDNASFVELRDAHKKNLKG
jgi:ATP-dependent protease ClpP protease subunit